MKNIKNNPLDEARAAVAEAKELSSLSHDTALNRLAHAVEVLIELAEKKVATQ
jgi:hypothetical protein